MWQVEVLVVVFGLCHLAATGFTMQVLDNILAILCNCYFDLCIEQRLIGCRVPVAAPVLQCTQGEYHVVWACGAKLM